MKTKEDEYLSMRKVLKENRNLKSKNDIYFKTIEYWNDRSKDLYSQIKELKESKERAKALFLVAGFFLGFILCALI